MLHPKKIFDTHGISQWLCTGDVLLSYRTLTKSQGLRGASYVRASCVELPSGALRSQGELLSEGHRC